MHLKCELRLEQADVAYRDGNNSRIDCARHSREQRSDDRQHKRENRYAMYTGEECGDESAKAKGCGDRVQNENEGKRVERNIEELWFTDELNDGFVYDVSEAWGSAFSAVCKEGGLIENANEWNRY